jgi:hypothetical protein
MLFLVLTKNGVELWSFMRQSFEQLWFYLSLNDNCTSDQFNQKSIFNWDHNAHC